MTGFRAWIFRSVVAAAGAWWLTSGGLSLAQDNDVWDRPPGGFWELGANWADGSAPGTLDRATFNVDGAYLVEFGTAPSAIRELNVTAGNVTFNSPGAFRTLNVTSAAFGGPQDVNITNGASLSLGTVNGFTIMPLHLTVGHELEVTSGATLNVRFGSDVITPILTIEGQINVTGLGSALTAGSTIIRGSQGGLNVTAGGVVQTTDVILWNQIIGTVSGAGSQWIDTGTIEVGRVSGGTLNITGGGKVQSLNGNISVFGGKGSVTVSGADSQWNISDSLTVGLDSVGGLGVTEGGSVSCVDGFLGKFSDSVGTATITGGAWTMTGRLSVAGDFVPGGVGTLNIQPAGTVSAAQGVVLFTNAHVNLQGGTLDASTIDFDLGNSGSQFQWTSGTLRVGTFTRNLTNSGGTLAPGHSGQSVAKTTIIGNYNQFSDAVLQIEIGGPLAGSEFDFVNVTGSAQVGGELRFALLGGFTPTPAQTFAILISNGLSGSFDNVASGQRVATSDGRGSFVVNYGFGSPFDDNQVVLSAFQPSVSGDFDLDGDVDGRDFLIWQRGGSPNPMTPADLAAWRGNYGFPGLTAPAAAVPEPHSLALFLNLAAAALASAARRRSAERTTHGSSG